MDTSPAATSGAALLTGASARASAGRLARPVDRALLISCVLLILLPFGLFWRLWWPDPAQRQAFAYGDFADQYYPMRAFVAYELRHGRLPLWDPFTYSGQPAAGASLYAPFYPLGLWETLFPDPLPYSALEVEAVLHLGLAGVFTCLLVRRLTGRTAAGLLAGVAFSLGGFLTSYPVLQLLILETAAWLPGVLWLLERALGRRSLRMAALAGAALGCALLAGHPQTFLYIAYLTAAFFVLRAWRRRSGWRFTLAAAALAGATAAALSAVQWLPTLELARLSPRAHLAYDELAHGFDMAEAWGILRANAGQWSPLYVGLVPLALALAALVLWPAYGGQDPSPEPRAQARRVWWPRAVEAWFWAVAAVLALLLAFGRNAGLYPLAYRWLPGFAVFRNQERAAFLVSFALAVLAGYGLAGSWAAVRAWRMAAPGPAEGASARGPAGKAAAPRAAALVTGVLVACTFLDLFHANAGLVLAPAPAGGYFAKTPAVAHVQSVSLAGWRMSSEGLLPGDGNAGLVFRVRDVAGNSPLHLQGYEEFLRAVPEVRWWQLLNVQHILTNRPLDHGALNLVRQDGDLRLYQVFVGAQGAWLSHAYEPAPDQAAAIAAAARPDLDPRRVTVLEARPEPLTAPIDEALSAAESAEVVTSEPARVAAEVHLSSPGLAVFSEIAYPGWIPYVSPLGAGGAGRPYPALRAFGLLRAVALPAGQWRVEWRYEPTSVRLGGWLTLAAVLGLTLILTLRKFQR